MNQKRYSNHKIFGMVEVLLLLILTCMFSFSAGQLLRKESGSTNIKKDEYINRFAENYEYITENYYGKIDKKELVDAAIKGMVESLGDDYSNFLDRSESNTFDISLKGEYNGLGISIAKYENKLTVIEVYDDTPAKKMGVEPFDIVKSIDGVDVTNREAHEVTQLIQEKSGDIHFVFIN